MWQVYDFLGSMELPHFTLIFQEENKAKMMNNEGEEMMQFTWSFNEFED